MRLRRRGAQLPLIHYVAPMVWAWRAGRARRMARWYDHLMALLPFEPPYFEAGRPFACRYVGHPVVESGADSGDGAGFRRRHAIAPDAKLLAVLPGSRARRGRRAFCRFSARPSNYWRRGIRISLVALPTTENVEADCRAPAAASWRVPAIVLAGGAEKYDAFAASDAALAASGTVALELAMARLPAVVAYRINPLTHALVRRIVKVKYANLVNLVLGPRGRAGIVAGRLHARETRRRRSRLLIDDGRRARGPSRILRRGARHALGYGCILAGRTSGRRRARRDRGHDAAQGKSRMPTTPPASQDFAPHHAARLRSREIARFLYAPPGHEALRKREVPEGRYTLAFVGYGDEAATR